MKAKKKTKMSSEMRNVIPILIGKNSKTKSSAGDTVYFASEIEEKVEVLGLQVVIFHFNVFI